MKNNFNLPLKSWRTWVFVFAFLVFNIWNFFRIDTVSHSVSDTLMNFVPEALVFFLALRYVLILGNKEKQLP